MEKIEPLDPKTAQLTLRIEKRNRRIIAKAEERFGGKMENPLDAVIPPKPKAAIATVEQEPVAKRKYGAVKQSVMAVFEKDTSKDRSVNDVVGLVRAKEPKLKEGTIRSTIASLKAKGVLVETRKDGRESFMRVSGASAEPMVRGSQKAGLGLAGDLAALEAALKTIENLKPVLLRLKKRFE